MSKKMYHIFIKVFKFCPVLLGVPASSFKWTIKKEKTEQRMTNAWFGMSWRYTIQTWHTQKVLLISNPVAKNKAKRNTKKNPFSSLLPIFFSFISGQISKSALSINKLEKLFIFMYYWEQCRLVAVLVDCVGLTSVQPFCLVVFCLSCSLSPCSHRLCVCHIFYKGNGTECNQSHASVSDYGGTVLYHLPFLCFLCANDCEW